MTPDFI